MKTTKILLSLAVAGTMLLSSCTKQGPAGPAGANGTSNMQTNTYTVTSGDWSSAGTNEFTYNTTLGVPTIDQVSVFWSSNGSTFIPMPSVNVFSTGDQLTFAYQTGAGLTLIYDNTAAPSSTMYVRVFVITPAAIKQHPGTDWNSYDQVRIIADNR